MTYHIKPQGDSFLVIKTADPSNPKDRMAERIIAVCGNLPDATAVLKGLYWVAAAENTQVNARGQH
jgi:hypothetical protein